jgi:hypothetical protein
MEYNINDESRSENIYNELNIFSSRLYVLHGNEISSIRRQIEECQKDLKNCYCTALWVKNKFQHSNQFEISDNNNNNKHNKHKRNDLVDNLKGGMNGLKQSLSRWRKVVYHHAIKSEKECKNYVIVYMKMYPMF